MFIKFDDLTEQLSKSFLPLQEKNLGVGDLLFFSICLAKLGERRKTGLSSESFKKCRTKNLKPYLRGFGYGLAGKSASETVESIPSVQTNSPPP